MNQASGKIKSAILTALPKAKKTIFWLLKIIIPVSLLVSILGHLGIITYIAHYLTPLFSVIGLPGESAIVFISSIFLPLYAPIAIISTLSLQVRQVTILAVMCLISHNLIVETAIQKKAGSNYFVMFLVRVLSSFAAAFILHWLLPENMGTNHPISSGTLTLTFLEMLWQWAIGTFWLVIKIILIITGLLVLQNLLKEFDLLGKISAFFAPFMSFFGLSANSSFLWFVAHTLGLTYGSAVITDSIDNKEISGVEAKLLNYHIAVNHSTVEDTLLFVAIGVPFLWMVIPRFIFSIIIVWSVRVIHKIKPNQKVKLG